jgi:hypothetical protein
MFNDVSAGDVFRTGCIDERRHFSAWIDEDDELSAAYEKNRYATA